jgi:hypothetical protein
MGTVQLTGLYDRKYDFEIADLRAPWNDLGGVYVFAKWDGVRMAILRVGKCASFKSRPMPPHHPCWFEAFRDHGATHVLARVNGDERSRSDEEQDLIAAYNPPMNVQLRTGALPGFASPPQMPGILGLGLLNQNKKK